MKKQDVRRMVHEEVSGLIRLILIATLLGVIGFFSMAASLRIFDIARDVFSIVGGIILWVLGLFSAASSIYIFYIAGGGEDE